MNLTPEQIEQERQKFEAIPELLDQSFLRGSNGGYRDVRIAMYWTGFLTCAESKQAALKAKDDEIEAYRIILAGVSVLSSCNTRESLDTQSQGIAPQYMHGAIVDVIKTAEREIGLLDRLRVQGEEIDGLRHLLDSKLKPETVEWAEKAILQARIAELVAEKDADTILMNKALLQQALNALTSFRDSVLNQRSQLQDWHDSDKINDVLGLFDDELQPSIESLEAAIAQPKNECMTCGGAKVVHRADGELLGECFACMDDVAQPEQEPIGYVASNVMSIMRQGSCGFIYRQKPEGSSHFAVYASPLVARELASLSDEDQKQIAKEMLGEEHPRLDVLSTAINIVQATQSAMIKKAGQA
jgi:hypothetical protein